MPLQYCKFITKKMMRANPDKKYIMGDNEKRVGRGGQAYEMRDEPNCIGVRTKRAPATYPESVYWTDETYEQNCAMIAEDMKAVIEHLDKGGIVVVPTDGIGTGKSELPKRAPLTMKYIEDFFYRLKVYYGVIVPGEE